MTPEMALAILTRLDKIIELVEFRNSIEQARDEMKQGNYLNDILSDPICICGQTTACDKGICPIHGGTS